MSIRHCVVTHRPRTNREQHYSCIASQQHHSSITHPRIPPHLPPSGPSAHMRYAQGQGSHQATARSPKRQPRPQTRVRCLLQI
ncbi:uncharacterized protein BKA78DRAFT_108482 [Phyllosticta capitalensis]|uniref:uncharacterized protein n=1 Tax=Phyllosticta capitalensis TaxID=121624 RepID=UPI00313210B0